MRSRTFLLLTWIPHAFLYVCGIALLGCAKRPWTSQPPAPAFLALGLYGVLQGLARCLESRPDFREVVSPDEGHGLSESEFQVPVYSSDITQDGNIIEECLSEYLVTPQVLSHRRATTLRIHTFWRAWSLNNKGHLIPVLASDELPSLSVKVLYHIISPLILSKL